MIFGGTLEPIALVVGYVVLGILAFIAVAFVIAAVLLAMGLLLLLGMFVKKKSKNVFLRWALRKKNPKHLRRLAYNYVINQAFAKHSNNMTRRQIIRKLWYIREVYVFKTRNDVKSRSRALTGR